MTNNTFKTIKIAAKDASKRNTGGGAADPGPGDPNAAPSVAPQLVDVPSAPTASQLVVKSTTAGRQDGSPTSAQPSGPPETGPMYSGPPLSGVQHSGAPASGTAHSTAAASTSRLSGAPASTSKLSSASPSTGKHSGVSGGSKHSGMSGSKHSGAPASGTKHLGPSPSGAMHSGTPASTSKPVGPSASTAMQADSGVVHDEDEEGEGEVEQPEEGAPKSPASGLDTTPASSEGGSVKMSTKTSKQDRSAAKLDSELAKNGSRTSPKSMTTGTGMGAGQTDPGAESGTESAGPGGKKKVTKFRYHKRITVRTSGKTSPAAIMDKVNKKDHRAGITPSTIDDMDPQELMQRAGIKGNKKTHWRVRLRQTKRVTKDGKTTTQTKVAYRDSEGNKRVKSSSSPFCKNCGKKLEECKCEADQSSQQ